MGQVYWLQTSRHGQCGFLLSSLGILPTRPRVLPAGLCLTLVPPPRTESPCIWALLLFCSPGDSSSDIWAPAHGT